MPFASVSRRCRDIRKYVSCLKESWKSNCIMSNNSIGFGQVNPAFRIRPTVWGTLVDVCSLDQSRKFLLRQNVSRQNNANAASCMNLPETPDVRIFIPPKFVQMLSKSYWGLVWSNRSGALRVPAELTMLNVFKCESSDIIYRAGCWPCRITKKKRVTFYNAHSWKYQVQSGFQHLSHLKAHILTWQWPCSSCN